MKRIALILLMLVCGKAMAVPTPGPGAATTVFCSNCVSSTAPTNTPTATFTITPTPNWTTTPTPTPFSFNKSIDTTNATPVVIQAAVPGYKVNVRGFTIENTNSTTTTAGSFYIDDGVVTIYGPVTLYGTVGTNVSIPYYAQGINRSLRFVNVNSVADMAGCVNYSIDLPGVR